MTDDKIRELVESEIQKPQLGLTEQFLEIHSVQLSNGKPEIVRIDRDSDVGSILAYLPVAGEKFHLAVCVDPDKKAVVGLYSEPSSRVYFRAISETISSTQMLSMTQLKPTESWEKGAQSRNGKSTYTFSSVTFSSPTEPDSFEDKLTNLLDMLEQDPDGIRKLVKEANGDIQVSMSFHNGNGMLGGPTISRDSIKRMDTLKLEINFDLYAEGNPYK